MNNKERYFEEEQPHAKIKHIMFEEIVKANISISNIFEAKSKRNDSYNYVEFHSGTGMFKDNEKGTPILAMDIINKIYKKNNFDKIYIDFYENKKSNFKKLKKSLSKYNNIKYNLNFDDWENFIPRNTKWGIIWADPFDTKLNLKLLLEKSKDYKLADILIYLNYNGIYRAWSANQKIFVTNGIMSENEVRERIENSNRDNFSKKFEDLIKELFKIERVDKDFIIAASLPISYKLKNTKKRNLKNINFGLILLATSSTGMVDKFLETYEKCIVDFRKYHKKPFTSDMFKDNNFKNKLKDLIKNEKINTLYDLFEKLWDDFISYKSREKIVIPTIKNTKKFLNNLLKEKFFMINTKDNIEHNYFDKNNQRIKEIKKKKDMKNLIILKQ